MWNAVQSIPHGEHNELVTSDLWTFETALS